MAFLLRNVRDGLMLVLIPAILSPLLLFNYDSPESRCSFVILLMIIFWIFQPIPLPVTALLPIVLFPLLGLSTTEKACEPYLQSTNMLFMASLIIAIAMENSGFHKRIALRTLLLMGDNIHALFGGFMFITMFLGIWIINTAATAMILPIADVVVAELFDYDPETMEPFNLNNGNSVEKAEEVTKVKDAYAEAKEQLTKSEQFVCCDVDQVDNPSRRLDHIRKLLYICIAYSATIGGTTTLTSNGPNLVFRFVLDEIYDGLPEVDYTNWMLFCLPATVLSVAICWILVCLLYLTKKVSNQIKRSPLIIIEQKYKELGRVTFHEFAVCFLFIVLIGLWMFRDPQFMDGWVKWLGLSIKPKDTTSAILIVFLMFCIPNKPLGPFPSESLLNWNKVQSKLAWGVIIFRGGGFAMAETATSSGLTKLIGHQLTRLNVLPVWSIIVIISVLASATTELASNSTIATIFLPISGQMASNLMQNPLLFLVPVTLSCSFAFVLPVGTPANALVSTHARLGSFDMFYSGLMVKLVCISVMLANLYTTGFLWFHLDTVPEWAFHNQTKT